MARKTKRILLGMFISGVTLFCLLLFPLALMFFSGKKDNRQQADAVVVFGAAVWFDDRPSHALTDRMMTGVRLYQDGLVPVLVLSGGPSESGSIHETDAMLRLAENAGVPRAALIPDVDGINTRASIRSTARIFRERGIEKVLVVSHWYHLPCIRMAYAQADIEVHTVPAHEEYVLLKLPYYLAREVAAWWAYRLQLM